MKVLDEKLLHALFRIRLVEEAIADRYAEQKMRCPVHLSIGQEAVAVGVCAHLVSTDYAVSGHRAHAHYLAKGGDLKQMLAEIYGKREGCCRGRGGSMHLIDLSVGFLGSTPIVGGSIPVGVGAAFGSVLKGESRVTAIFLGEGATEEGVFSESLNFAALHHLPILFICENNLYSVYSPLSVRQPKERDLVSLAKAHGLQAERGEGTDVEEVSRLAKGAVEKIRKEGGPIFLEFSTYRFREHCGPFQDPYQPQEQREFWNKKDFRWGHEGFDVTEIQKEIEEAFLFAENASFPTLREDELDA